MKKPGQIVYIVSNGWMVDEAVIIRISYGFYTLKFTSKPGATKLKEHRIFEKKTDAENKVRQLKREHLSYY